MKKVGIFSGTFDPIHEGHVLFAQTALEQFGLDEVLFLIEELPRRKTEVSDIDHRKVMLKLALEDFPSLSFFDSKIAQHTLSSTMLEIVDARGGDDAYVLLMGADLFEQIESWPDFKELGRDLAYIVALRTEDDGEVVIPLAQKLDLQVEFIPSPLSSISSRDIRSAVQNDAQPRGLNEEVEKYIDDNLLYKA